MKKLFVLILSLLMGHIASYAQQGDKAVAWTVEAKKATNGEGSEYTLTAKAVMEKGFHIWAMEAGGDGSLIPTSINVIATLNWKGEWVADQTAHAERMEFIEGTVYSYSQEVNFTRNFSLTKGLKKIKGVITYQSCNESMCLPPQDVPFEVTIP